MKSLVTGTVRPFIVATVLLFSVFPASVPAPQDGIPDATAGRQEINLNGAWEFVVTDNLSYPPPASGWNSREVPFLASSNAIQGALCIWYRKRVNIPLSFQNKKIDLVLCGARYNASVWCNGAFIASRQEGFTPWELDISGPAAAGKSCLLEIRCQDWSAVFKDNYTLPPDTNPDWETLRTVPKGRLLAPIGGFYTDYGIWDDVLLVARPFIHYEDVAVTTSVREKNLFSVTGHIAGGRIGLRLEAAVLDNKKPVLSIASRTSGSDHRFTLTARFPHPRYWSPEDPHLYTLVLTIRDGTGGTVIDRYELRFGFRELWAEGPDLYLNGVKRHLLASSGWPTTHYQSDEEIRQAIRSIKEANAVAFRLHTQPWQRRWLDLADQEGLMLVEEGALWCDGGGSYAYDDDRFWNNVDIHLAGMVRRDRNHPSLVMWSIENEILHCGATSHCDCAEDRLAAAGRRVKALDPTHLITYEADHDPGGVADVIGLHYPREMPENIDYPNTADWLGTTVTTGTAGGTAGSWNREFSWDRKKPLYIGEYLWIFRQDFSAGTVFFGDAAYRDKDIYKDLSKARAWEIQTVAYRRAGVSGMCPWTIADQGGLADRESPLFAAQKKAYTPVAIFQREFDSRFFSGEKVRRSFDVFNDSTRRRALEVRVSLTGWKQGYRERFTLEPAGHRVVTLTVPLPGRNVPDDLFLEAALYAEGKKVHAVNARYRVRQKTTLSVPERRTLLILDPQGSWPAPAEKAKGHILSTPADLARYNPSSSLLVIAPNAFGKTNPASLGPVIGSGHSGPALFRRFLENGGGILVLEQENVAQIMPELELVSHPATMTFPVSTGHPLLEGLDAEDCAFWRGDHYVTRREIKRPERGGARAVLVSGGLDCLDQTPLLEMNIGPGKIVFCQALAGAKYATEPAARRLVANALKLLAAPRQAPSRVLVMADGRDALRFREKLAEIGITNIEPSSHLLTANPATSDILILHGGGDAIDSLAPALAARTALARPLTVYWHAPHKKSFDRLKKAFGLERAFVIPSAGPVSLAAKTGSALDGVLREDVTYIKPFTASNWYHVVDFESGVIDRALDLGGPISASDRYETESWNLSGPIVNLTSDKNAVLFATNGAAHGIVTIARAGLYRLRLAAWGTPAAGEWPMVQVKADGKTVARVGVTGRHAEEIPFLALLPAGRLKVELRYFNDLYTNGEDRNLFIDALLVERLPLESAGIDSLTLPPAVIEARPKPGLRVVIDCVRWDSTVTNRVRGLRYASALLGGLGASFLPPGAGAEWIAVPQFRTAGDIAVFSRTDTSLNFGSAGRVTAVFTCAAAGRYTVMLRGWSTPLKGVYGKARVRIDGREVSETEMSSGTPREFTAGIVRLAAGDHEISIEFTNDQWAGPGGEDRNLYLTGAGFRAEK